MTLERRPELEDVLQAAQQKALAAISVAMPAKVTAFNAGSASQFPTVDVTCCLGNTIVEEDREATDPAVSIAGVPLIYPGSGVNRITFPIANGDYVLLIVADRSTDEFIGQGGVVTPAHLHSHNITDCFAIPGILAPTTSGLTGVSTSKMIIGKLDGTAHAGAARNGDSVKVTIPAGSFLISCSGSPAVGVLNPAGVDVTGTITAGSGTVEITG